MVVRGERLQLDMRKNFQVLIQDERLAVNLRTSMLQFQQIV